MEFIKDYPWLAAIILVQIIGFISKTIMQDRKQALTEQKLEAMTKQIEKNDKAEIDLTEKYHKLDVRMEVAGTMISEMREIIKEDRK